MADKYGYSADTRMFEIDPAVLADGISAASASGHPDIRIRAHDGIASKAILDVALLSTRAGIRQLAVDRDIALLKKADFPLLERLSGLQVLKVREHLPLDFAKLPRLEEVVLFDGTALRGMDSLRELKILFLLKWKAAKLPDNAADIVAPSVRIGDSRKLDDIDALYRNRHVTALKLQSLPMLHVNRKINGMTSLEALHLESVRGADFAHFAMKSLRSLTLSKVDSLRFIAHLPNLEDLNFWELDDGDMTPILQHATLRVVSFPRQKKHYSHDLRTLQDELRARHPGKH